MKQTVVALLVALASIAQPVAAQEAPICSAVMAEDGWSEYWCTDPEGLVKPMAVCVPDYGCGRVRWLEGVWTYAPFDAEPALATHLEP